MTRLELTSLAQHRQSHVLPANSSALALIVSHPENYGASRSAILMPRPCEARRCHFAKSSAWPPRASPVIRATSVIMQSTSIAFCGCAAAPDSSARARPHHQQRAGRNLPHPDQGAFQRAQLLDVYRRPCWCCGTCASAVRPFKSLPPRPCARREGRTPPAVLNTFQIHLPRCAIRRTPMLRETGSSCCLCSNTAVGL